MSFIKKIFGSIWMLWGAVVFMSVVIVLTIIYAFVLGIFGRKYSMACVWINCRVASPLILSLILIRLKVFGKEKLDPNKTYVMVANHTSQVDIISSAAACVQPMRFLAKAEIKYIPVFGYMVKMLGIMVDRKSKESREKSYRYMVEAVKKGESLFLYPEGTRNRTPEPLKEFKDGAFKVAVMAQVPIAVQTIVSARALNPATGYQLYPGKVEVYWSTPIETTGLTPADIPMLKEKVRNEMLKHLCG